MVVFEALNALYGDCLLLRYSGAGGVPRSWIIDGGPRAANAGGARLSCWKEVLLPRLKQIDPALPFEVALGMVSHIDDDHINGMQRLTSVLVAASPAPGPVKFRRFWFNAFEQLVGSPGAPAPQGDAAPAALAQASLPGVADEDSQAIVQSVGQGMDLAADLRTLHLGGNVPVGGLVAARKGQAPYDIDGAKVTVLGPLQGRLDKLRADWAAAAAKPDREAREAAVQALFLPDQALDKSVPNLSSVVVLVEVGGRKLLLTGDAQGADLVTAWQELGFGDGPVEVDLLKLPHHGSIRNIPERFLSFFPATHYVFSANGKYDNPDPETVEAVVKLHGARGIVLHFTNADVTWSKPYALDRGGTVVRELADQLRALRAAYGGAWTARFRAPDALSVVVEL